MSHAQIKVVTADPTLKPDLPMPKSLAKYINKTNGTKPAQVAEDCMVSVNLPMHSAQRQFYPNDVTKWITKTGGIDWNLFGTITVIRNTKTGRMEVLNGQHRLQAVRWMLPGVEKVPAHVIDTDDEEYQHRLFAYGQGLLSRRLKAEELFSAMVGSGDAEALYYKSILERAGLSCGTVNAADDTLPIKYASFTQAVNMCKRDADEVINVAELWREAFPKNNVQAQVLTGMVRLFTLESYKDQGDINTKYGKLFHEWFTTNVPANFKPINLNFPEFHNTNFWPNGVAFGLQQKFNIWLDFKDVKRVPIKQIKKIYEAGINSGKDSAFSDDDE